MMFTGWLCNLLLGKTFGHSGENWYPLVLHQNPLCVLSERVSPSGAAPQAEYKKPCARRRVTAAKAAETKMKQSLNRTNSARPSGMQWLAAFHAARKPKAPTLKKSSTNARGPVTLADIACARMTLVL